MRKLLTSLLLAVSFNSFGEDQKTGAAQSSPTIYHGGDILTMDGNKPSYVQTVVENNGKIIYIGDKKTALEKFQDKARIIDLKNKTMLPGFIDGHSHFMFAMQITRQVNISSPPAGEIKNIPDILKTLKEYQQEKNIPENEWVIGWGYDNDILEEKRHPTKIDLDSILPHHKVMIIHVSGHGAVLNSKALEDVGITKDTITPAGGVIARMENSTEPAGLLMEMAYLPAFQKMPLPTEAEMLELMDETQQIYASQGYTHVQEGSTQVKDMRFLKKAAKEEKIYLDIVSLPVFIDFEKWFNNPEFPFGEYNNHLKFQGIKITQDGSPQGKTAYVTKPYLTDGLAGQKNWVGETSIPQAEFDTFVKTALDNNIQVFIHANGDATIDQAINAVEKAGITAKDDRRTVIIHSQFQRPKHLPKYIEFGLTPSYFTNHTFYWGDVHIQNIGKENAFFISPLKSAVEQGLTYSNHTDFNVTSLDPFFVLWTAITRTSRSGTVIGPDERVDVYTALQGLTTGPAYQVFEENRKGKIKEGFLADFVILDKNPLKVETTEIRDIQVLETIKEGKSIYKK